MKVLFDPAKTESLVRMQAKLTNNMHGAFNDLRNDVKAKGPWRLIQSSLVDAIVFTRLEGYRQAALAVGYKPIAGDYIKLRLDGVARADWVASQMRGWTNESLQASKKSKLLSKKRAAKASTFESRKAFYDGALKGFSLNKASRKSWLTSDEHDVDDICDDNEDDGIIEIGEAFSSGAMSPPAHLFCLCTLWLHM